MCSMANNRKTHNISCVSGDETRNLKRELGKLDQPEKDYMENLANSLLQIQNGNFTQKPSPIEDKPDDALSNDQ